MNVPKPEYIDFPGSRTVVVRFSELPVSRMPEAMDRAYRALGEALQQGAFRPAGLAFSRYESVPGETATFETGFPVEDPLAEAMTVGDVRILPSELPACTWQYPNTSVRTRDSASRGAPSLIRWNPRGEQPSCRSGRPTTPSQGPTSTPKPSSPGSRYRSRTTRTPPRRKLAPQVKDGQHVPHLGRAPSSPFSSSVTSGVSARSTRDRRSAIGTMRHWTVTPSISAKR